MKNLFKKNIVYIAALSLALIGAGGFGITKVLANPSIFAPATTLLSATYLVPTSIATSSAVDAENVPVGGFLRTKTNEAFMLVKINASSTADLELYYRFQHSADNSTWYDESDVLEDHGTTTPVVPTFKDFRYIPVASSTLASDLISDGAGEPNGTSSQSNLLISVPTPLRYTRALFYIKEGNGLATSTNAAVRAVLQSAKERAEY